MARRSIHRGGAVGLSLALSLGWVAAGGARAEPNPVQLSIESGAPAWLQNCLSEAKLNTSYRTVQAGSDAAADPLSPLAISVHAVEQKGREATLEIRAHRSSQRDLGSRVLRVHANDCAAVPDAVALVLLLLSRSASAEPEPLQPATDRTPAVAAIDPELPPALAPPQPLPEPTPLEVRAGAGVSLVWGVLPNAALGFAVEGELGFAPWSARVRAQLLWPQTPRIAEGSVRLVPFGFGADACLGSSLPAPPWFGLRACAGPRVGLIHASGRGFRLQNRAPLEPLLHLGATLELAARLADPTWLRLSASGDVALLRPRFVVQVHGVAEPNEVAGPRLFRGELGVSVVQIF